MSHAIAPLIIAVSHVDVPLIVPVSHANAPPIVPVSHANAPLIVPVSHANASLTAVPIRCHTVGFGRPQSRVRRVAVLPCAAPRPARARCRAGVLLTESSESTTPARKLFGTPTVAASRGKHRGARMGEIIRAMLAVVCCALTSSAGIVSAPPFRDLRYCRIVFDFRGIHSVPAGGGGADPKSQRSSRRVPLPPTALDACSTAAAMSARSSATRLAASASLAAMRRAASRVTLASCSASSCCLTSTSARTFASASRVSASFCAVAFAAAELALARAAAVPSAINLASASAARRSSAAPALASACSVASCGLPSGETSRTSSMGSTLAGANGRPKRSAFSWPSVALPLTVSTLRTAATIR